MRYVISNRGLTTVPAPIEYKGYRFVITDNPRDACIDMYLEELRYFKVTHLVRACELTYDPERITDHGIQVIGLNDDGASSIPKENIKQWFRIIKRHCDNKNACIAVHCKTGLGRAPFLVALALIELGMKTEDAVELIRDKKHGAISATQLDALERYRPKARLKPEKLDLRKFLLCI